MKRVIIFSLIVLVFILPLNIRSLTVGSLIAANVEGTTVLPTGTGSLLQGFTVFSAGFAFTDSSTTCSFNAYFPVSGAVTLSNGALYLQQDLWFEQPITFTSVGTIVGNGNSLHLPSLLTSFSLPTLPITLPVIASVNPNSEQIFSVDWSYDNAYVAVGTFAGGTKTLNIYSFNGSALTLKIGISPEDATYGVSSVSWHPSNYFLAISRDTGGVVNENQVYIYQFNPAVPSLITTTTLTIASAVEFVEAIVWSPNGNYIAYSDYVSTASAGVFVASVSAGVISSPIYYGQASGSGGVQSACLSWNASGNYLALGSFAGTSHKVLEVLNFNGTTLTSVANVTSTFNVTGLDWSKTNSLIAVGFNSSTNNVQLYSFSSTASTLTQLSAALLGETRNIGAIQWNPAGTLLAVAYTNAAFGATIYSFNTTTSVLTPYQQMSYTTAINALRWSHDGSYLALGDANDLTSIYKSANNLILNNITLVLQGDLVLTVPYEFQGSCAIEGNGYAINCSSGAIQIDSGATLLIRNATVTGINAKNIIGLTSTSALSLQNSTWVQSGNYTFSEGALNIIDNVTMNGQYSFIYTSSQATTINSDSSWLFDSGMTFSYAPTSGANNLLVMTDSTSLFHLYETTLYAPSTGLKFTKGVVVIEGICPVMSSATSQANGILFGDGISSANNALLNVWPGSNFQINSGFVLYQNV